MIPSSRVGSTLCYITTHVESESDCPACFWGEVLLSKMYAPLLQGRVKTLKFPGTLRRPPHGYINQTIHQSIENYTCDEWGCYGITASVSTTCQDDVLNLSPTAVNLKQSRCCVNPEYKHQSDPEKSRPMAV